MYVKSAFSLCLTPFVIFFTLDVSFEMFTAVKHVYSSIFSSLTNVDPLDISFSENLIETSTQRFLLGSEISIKSVFLIDADEQNVEMLMQNLTISQINSMLPLNMARILSISVYGVQYWNKSLQKNGTVTGNNQSQNVFQESSFPNPQINVALFVGAGLAIFLLIGCSTYAIWTTGKCQSGISHLHSVQLSRQPSDNENAGFVSLSIPEEIPGLPLQKDADASNSPISISLAADIANIGPGYKSQNIPAGNPVIAIMNSDQTTSINENVKHIDFSEIFVDAEISQGSFKSVFRATWKSPPTGLSGWGGEGITVAMLVLRHGGGMAREIEVFEKLGCHPHLTKLLAVTTNLNGCQCLITEYAALGSLDHVLHEFADRHVQISDLVLLTACMQICDGMEVLTEHQLIHRDLAARNVLVFKFNESNKRSVLVKITDYGLTVAGNYVQLSTSSVNCGVPIRWMPPEAS
jgi:hypothetical protein